MPIFLAVAGTPFLESQVRIQHESCHRVMTTGPYRVVRHPMSSRLLLLPGSGRRLGQGLSKDVLEGKKGVALTVWTGPLP